MKKLTVKNQWGTTFEVKEVKAFYKRGSGICHDIDSCELSFVYGPRGSNFTNTLHLSCQRNTDSLNYYAFRATDLETDGFDFGLRDYQGIALALLRKIGKEILHRNLVVAHGGCELAAFYAALDSLGIDIEKKWQWFGCWYDSWDLPDEGRVHYFTSHAKAA